MGLQIDLSELYSTFSDETYEIMEMSISKLRSRRDQLNYRRAYLDFYAYTSADPRTASHEDVRKYVSSLHAQVTDGELSASTANKNHRILAALFHTMKHLSEDGSDLVPSDFFNQMSYYPAKVYDDKIERRNIPSVEEIDRIVGYCRAHDEELLLVIMLCLKCFLYLRDIPLLTVSNLFYDSSDRCFLNITTRNHTVAIPRDLAELFERYLASHDNDEYIFPQSVSVSAWYRLRQLRLKKMSEQLDLPSYTFNDFRSAGIVYAHSNGMPTDQLADAVGYKTSQHIKRLTSLKIDVPSPADYININVKTASC